ncbi:MAG: hypothetical protein M9921_13215 [Fimbriimonadaceae bacterium]|nr:hypothetical protein [Fimbriimonadaceae bacterium]
MRSVHDRLEDVTEAIRRIEQEQAAGREAFDDDPKTQACGWSATSSLQ